MASEIIEKILESNKITKEELDKKISEKMESLSGLISEDGAAHIIAGELGIQTSETPSSTEPMKISKIVGGMKSVTLLARVIKKYDLRHFGEDNSGKVLNLLIGDDTGISRLTFWNDKCDLITDLNEGDVIEVQNAYTKDNNGRVEIQMGNSSNCIINPKGKTVELIERKEQTENPKKINEITEQDTYIDVTATIVQVYDPRFFEVCPECNKRMQISDNNEYKCSEHGVKEPKYNSVMNIFLDDGSGNIRATLWREQIQALLSKTEEELVKLKDDSQLLEEAKNDLLGKIIKARAKVSKNDAFNQLELVLYRIDLNPEPTQESVSSEKGTEIKKEVKSEEPKTETDSQKADAPSTVEETVEDVISDDDEELFNVEDLDED